MHTTETGATRPDAVLELLEPDHASYVRAVTRAQSIEFSAALEYEHAAGDHRATPYHSCTRCLLERVAA
jgi:hypothetical protein